jgi:hypothetical protein
MKRSAGVDTGDDAASDDEAESGTANSVHNNNVFGTNGLNDVNTVRHWELAEWQFSNEGDARQRARGGNIKENLIAKLLGDDYSRDVVELGTMNPAIFSLVKRLCTSGSRHRAERSADGNENSSHGFGISMLMCMMQRLHTHHTIHFLTACLSLLAVRNNLDKMFWGVLSSLGLLFSYTFSQELAQDFGERVRERPRTDGMTSIIVAAADNKAYSIRTSVEHADPIRQTEFLQTTNWLTSVINKELGIREINSSSNAAPVNHPFAMRLPSDYLQKHRMFRTCSEHRRLPVRGRVERSRDLEPS